MRVMRAKMQVSFVEIHANIEVLNMVCVAKAGGYPPDGMDEDNSFALWSPSGTLKLTVANPDLHGKFKPGDRFYVDFTKAE